MWLYTLKLRQGMYYVGTTGDLDKRISQHASGHGSAWTARYPYVNVLQTRKVDSILEEDLEVKKLMQIHGIDCVRGGTYSSLSLSDEQKSSLQRELDHADSKCTRCGRGSHWVAQCHAKRHVNGQELGGAKGVSLQKRNFQGEGGAGGGYKRCRYEERGEASDKQKPSLQRELVHADSKCIRCGRGSHWVAQCYATRHVNGQELEDESDEGEDESDEGGDEWDDGGDEWDEY